MNLAGATLPAEVRTAVNWANFGNAIANNDYAGMAAAASVLTGSSDLKVAASALNFKNALDLFNRTGNMSALVSAGTNFGNTIKGLGNVTTNVTTTPTTVVADGSDIVVGIDADGKTITLDKIDSLFSTAYTSSPFYASLNSGVYTDAGTGKPTVVEIENTAEEGQPGFGWRYFSDGTVISPTGTYYQDNKVVSLSEQDKVTYLAGAAATSAAALLVQSPQLVKTLSGKVSATDLPGVLDTLKNWWSINPASQYTNANQVDTDAFRSYLKAQGVSDANIDYVIDASKTAVNELISKTNVDVDTSTTKATNILNTIGTKVSATEADAAISAANILKTISSDSLASSNDAQVKAKA
jgi:hypothetical protein